MIDVTDLGELARVCQSLLLAQTEPENVANPYLHPLNAHPSSLARYDGLKGKGPNLKQQWRARAAGAAVVLQGLGSQGAFNGDPLPEQADVLFVSHLLRASQAGDGQDLYFGSAAAELDRRGLRTITAMINHSGRSWRALAPDWRAGEGTRVLLAKRLDLPAELTIGRRLAGAGQRLRHRQDLDTSALARAVREQAAGQAASTGSRTALRIGLQIETMVARLQPRMIVLTYEGHSWERLAFWHARRAKPDIVCVGYHHAVLFPFTKAMIHRLGQGYDPDAIVTAGNTTRDWLRRQAWLSDIPITTLGSVRVPAMAGLLSAVALHRACLVIPEGTHSESLKLITVAAQAARKAPQLGFYIRLHPALRPDSLRRESALQALPPNMIWSTASFEDDLRRCRWALYRGSTAVISATLSGLKPIYFDDGGISIDPLDALTDWRARIVDGDELVSALQADLSTPEDQRQTGFDTATAYCRQCFTKFDLQVLQSLIESKS